jgi:glycosidase
MGTVVRRRAVLAALALVSAVMVPITATSASAATDSVTIAGSMQSEVGCPGDWAPDCATTHLTQDATDGIWQGTFTLPAGSFEYKAAINDSWDVNYGANAQLDGPNIAVAPSDSTAVKFYYDDKTHWVTDSLGSVIATAAGSFQSELGCSGDWQPDCLRSWLQDPDGDGTYTFSTTALPPGDYQAKAAINESWDENYGANGTPNGDNIGFSVADAGQRVDFRYDSTSHLLTITVEAPAGGSDNNVEWDGLRHDSRDTLYRTPGGAVPEGTPVTLRMRTFHDDVTGVRVRTYSVDKSAQTILPMTRAASDVSCYQAGLADKACDYWQVTLPNAEPDSIWYRFLVTDGTKTVSYADDTAALEGGLGKPSDDVIDNSWALSVYERSFRAPGWAKNAVIYQVFPDRFRDGSKRNNPKTGDVRYDDPVQALTWGTMPEGYCRNYVGATATSCPWRFGQPPNAQSDLEQPRGRDYQGGDLVGLDQKLNQLKALGVTAVYLNPIFDAGSNHGYDTQDYTKVDPYFGTQKDFDSLVKHASQKGIRLILDGVFNHMSSDSPFFDRYGHYPTVGACESASSPYRSWFTFRKPTGDEPKDVCAPSTPGGEDTYYDGWFGFDSIPVLTKSDAAVQKYFLTSKDSIAKRWLLKGAAGWRMDVMGDPSFPDGYWETFRKAVKGTKSDALIISETWQKDSTLLRMLQGDRADSTMNYRLRDAVIGLLAPGTFDSKGFADSGRPISPTEFGNRIASIAEDYPGPALFSAMNLLDSHDTERLAWTLTPGSENRADKEQTAANVLAGKRSVQLASLLQFSMPGAPTIYYGDEVGVTGDDDPDDRRAYPWKDRGGSPDAAMQAHYTALASVRRQVPALRTGDLRILSTNDTDGTIAIGRATPSNAALVVVNRSNAAHTLSVPVAGYLPEGTPLSPAYTVGGSSAKTKVADGVVRVKAPARGAVILEAADVDRTPPKAPRGLTVTKEAATTVDLSWQAVPGAAGYDVYTSPVTGGGYTKVTATPLGGTTYTVTGLRTGQPVYIVVRAVDRAGNSSDDSREVSALPHFTIGWANLQHPPTLTHTISAVNSTAVVYGQVWIDGVTSQVGATPTLLAQLGFGPDGSNPASDPSWSWVDASFNTDAGNNDEFKASLLPSSTGQFDYAYRYSTTGGREWLYADLDGSTNGYSAAQAGALTVAASSDTTAPAKPAGLRVTSAGPSEVHLAWDAVADGDVAFYEVQRAPAAAGAFAVVGTSKNPEYTDAAVSESQSFRYRVLAVDTSFNRSEPCDPVTATAELRKVTVTFTVTVPASTDGTGRAVNIAGFLDRLDGGLPQWDPAGSPLTRVDATTWRITLTGMENTAIEYKYALADWNYVEKTSTCAEVDNRPLTLTYGTGGTQQVNDTVANWRNVTPCGN